MSIEIDYMQFRETVERCPWCTSENFSSWGTQVRGFESAECQSCKIIFVVNRLSSKGLELYYKNYLQEIHQADAILNIQRDKMYEIEFEFVHNYIKVGSVLDVGYSGGYFLDKFKDKGFECWGIEFGEQAASEAARKYEVYIGELPKIKIDRKFDLIIFRGVIEHVPYPKDYLNTAISLLNESGLIFITSTPDADSICCKLFKEMWNQHVPEAHILHLNRKVLDEYFRSFNFYKIANKAFYEEAPYANVEQDILKVASAIEKRNQGDSITFTSPPFWGNMMSILYKKQVS